MYTASTALLETLYARGVSYVFANFGSDHPAIVEAIAEARATGRPIPTILTCPNEMVALSCAHGCAQVSGRAQAVFVHVDCGTQALAGAVHNAARNRAPVLIFAGLSPFTHDGELPGSRNEFIHWLQDTRDQRGIVRQYVKYENELRTATNLPQIVARALQLAESDPKGPVYLVGAREVMEAQAEPAALDPSAGQPVAPQALDQEAVSNLAAALAGAKRPLIVTSYAGRRPAIVGALVRLCRRLGIGVLESAPSHVNYPHDDDLYQGNQWSQPDQNEALAEADVILVIDSDVPWIPSVSRPDPDAAIYHIDVDPLKPWAALWSFPARRAFQADALTAVRQLNARLDQMTVDGDAVAERIAHYAARHRRRAQSLAEGEQPNGDVITPAFLTACIRRQIPGDAIVLNEGITNYGVIADHIGQRDSGTLFTSGASSLGWHGGAAIGAKLAAPQRTVVALTGDGTYLFSVPSTVHWMARRYGTPFLQVIYNNRGWAAPKFSTLQVHPRGHAARADDIDVAFDPPPDYAAIAAAAGGAHARTVRHSGEVEGAIAEALAVMRTEKRAAVLDVWLPHL